MDGESIKRGMNYNIYFTRNFKKVNIYMQKKKYLASLQNNDYHLYRLNI